MTMGNKIPYPQNRGVLAQDRFGSDSKRLDLLLSDDRHHGQTYVAAVEMNTDRENAIQLEEDSLGDGSLPTGSPWHSITSLIQVKVQG